MIVISVRSNHLLYASSWYLPNNPSRRLPTKKPQPNVELERDYRVFSGGQCGVSFRHPMLCGFGDDCLRIRRNLKALS